MKHSDIANQTIDEIAKVIPSLSLDEFRLLWKSLTQEQVLALTPLLSPSYCRDWRQRLQSSLTILEEPAKIEAFGKGLDSIQFQEIIDILTQVFPDQRWKLSPLLVGLPHKVFSHFLGLASPSQLETLKHEAIAE